MIGRLLRSLLIRRRAVILPLDDRDARLLEIHRKALAANHQKDASHG